MSVGTRPAAVSQTLVCDTATVSRETGLLANLEALPNLPKVSATFSDADFEKRLREERRQRIFDLWLASYTVDEIAEQIGDKRSTVGIETGLCPDLEALPNLDKVPFSFSDADFEAPLYNVWAFSKKSSTRLSKGSASVGQRPAARRPTPSQRPLSPPQQSRRSQRHATRV